MIEHPEQHTRLVLLYSKENLQLDAADATKLHCRMMGRMATTTGTRDYGSHLSTGNSYFFVPRTWRRTQGKLIVLRQDGLRIEFVR